MKKLNRSMMVIAASGVALFAAFNSSGQQTPFYIKTGVGPALTQNTPIKEFNGPISGTVKFDPGVQFRVAAGFFINEWLSTELESGITYNNIDSISGASHVDASLVNAPFLVNLVATCPPNRVMFSPYVGGGVGGSSSVLDAEDINIGGLHLSDTRSDAVFAYHGFAGVRYNISDRMGVSLEYRYFGTTSPTWQSDVFFAGGGTGRTRFGENRTHSLTVAFSYNF